MNKIYFSLIIIFVFTNAAISQSETPNVYDFRNEFTVEPFIAISNSGFSEQVDFIARNSVSNFSTGILVDYHFNPRWSIRTGIIYDRMGNNSITFSDIDGFTSNGYKRTYVSIPIMANWHFGKRKRWNLGLGVTRSFGSEIYFFSIADVDDSLQNFLSSTLEIGYSFPVGPGFVHISINGINSFSDTFGIFTQRRNLNSIGYIIRL